MQITCPSCQKKVSIDDAKVPKQAFSIKCPGCATKIPVTPPRAAVAPPPPQVSEEGQETPASEEKALPPLVEQVPEESREDEAPPPPQATGGMETLKKEIAAEVLKHLGIKSSLVDDEEEENENAPSAFVCEDEAMFQEVISSTLKKMGYRVEVAATAADAVAKLQKQSFDIVTVDNRFPDDPEGGYKILQTINSLQSEPRRRIYVAFVSADLTTMDTNSAFILGANITISKKDIKRLDKVLKQGLDDHQKLYRTFHHVQEELTREQY